MHTRISLAAIHREVDMRTREVPARGEACSRASVVIAERSSRMVFLESLCEEGLMRALVSRGGVFAVGVAVSAYGVFKSGWDAYT